MNFFDNIEKEQLVELYDYFENMRKGSQIRKLGEEHQELLEQLVLFDYGMSDINCVIEELADNFILLFQHAYALDITDEEIKKAIKGKLTRTLERVATKYYEKH